MKNINERKYDLIITVVNRGFADQVIESARESGAGGATIFNARGSGAKDLEKFFEVYIQPEKEMILMVVKREETETIMKSIISSSGLNSKGHGICFSLPASNVLGISHFDNEYLNND